MRTLWKSMLVLLLAASAVGTAPAQPARDVPLTGATTESDIRAAWGEPAERRGNWVSYPNAPGGELHLMFSPLPPHRLIYAYRYGQVPGRRAGVSIFNTNEWIAQRELGQIDPCATEAGSVVPIWGWPNFTTGWPVTERYYFMANGELVRLGAEDAMRGIAVLRSFDHSLIRRISPRDCPQRAPVPTPDRLRESPSESFDPFAPPRLLSDIPLAAGTTSADVEAIWGHPRTVSDWEGYRLASGEKISLLFSRVAPFGLVYADLHPAGEGPSRRLFSNNVRAATRSLGQVGLCPRFASMLWDLWGPADWEVASGFFRAVYVMANGDEVTFISPGDPFGMRILHPSGEEERIDCPRAPEPSG